VVLGLTALPLSWEKHPDTDESSDQAGETEPPPGPGFVLQHSTTVMTLGLFLGAIWFKSAPTMIANTSASSVRNQRDKRDPQYFAAACFAVLVSGNQHELLVHMG
jgi:hypothetical protein